MNIGDIMLYNNREYPRLNNTLVLIMGNNGRMHRKVMFLKDGVITENCWVGYLLPVGDSHVSR